MPARTKDLRQLEARLHDPISEIETLATVARAASEDDLGELHGVGGVLDTVAEDLLQVVEEPTEEALAAAHTAVPRLAASACVARAKMDDSHEAASELSTMVRRLGDLECEVYLALRGFDLEPAA